jgi:hypothetical protein
MKRLLIVLSALALNSCAVYDAYMMTGFDGNEYQLITQIRVDAGKFKNQCEDLNVSIVNANTMAYETQMFESYSQYIPHNKDTYSASKSLNEIAQGLVTRYKQPNPVPAIFCKLKFTGIEHSAETMQTVIGKRPR